MCGLRCGAPLSSRPGQKKRIQKTFESENKQKLATKGRCLKNEKFSKFCTKKARQFARFRLFFENYVDEYSVIELLETKLKKSDFITTGHYHIRLKPNTAKLLIEKIKNNFNQRYEFRNKQYALENIMFEDIRELSRYIIGNSKHLEFSIPDMAIKRNDNSQIRERIMSIDPEKRKELKINKSTLWYQQKKIKEGKTMKICNKTKVKIELKITK